MGKGSKQRPTDNAAFDDNFDRIFGKSKTLEQDKIKHWCNNCRSPLTDLQICTVKSPETAHSKASEDRACELCGFGGVVDYEFQDLSSEEKLYLN